MNKTHSDCKLYIVVFVICLMTDILQSFCASVAIAHGVLTLVLIAILIYSFIKIMHKSFTVDHTATLLITMSLLLCSIYVLRTDVFTLQHDEGTFSAIDDGLTNGGHLGYIEYFIKNTALPDFNPFDVFSYYHPPLHHILSAIFVYIHLTLGCAYDVAFESIQVLTCAYVGITMIFSYKSLRFLGEIFEKTNFKKLILPLCLILFHPSFIFLSGSVNNDALTTMLICITMYFCLRFIKNNDFASLMYIALFLGLSLIGKMNAAVAAFPIGMLLLLRMIEAFKNKTMSQCIKRYLCFLGICAPIGLSFTIRNFIRFHEKPGILSANPDSFLYIGNYSLSERLLLPSDLAFDYPFHNIYGESCGNTWLILLRTSLFSELRPEDTPFIVHSAQIASVAAFIFAILILIACMTSFIGMLKAGKRELGIYYLSFMFILPLTYIAFVLKYPYTCSCDFRYIISILFILSQGYFLSLDYNSMFFRILKYGLYISQTTFIVSSLCTCLCAIR